MRITYLYRKTEKSFESDKTEVIVGRPKPDVSPRPDLDLSPDLTVSRVHARLWETAPGQCFLEDLGSLHGTQVNGIEIKGLGAQPVQLGDRICIGETEMRLAGEGEGAARRTLDTQRPRLPRSYTATFTGTAPSVSDPHVEIMSSYDASMASVAVADAAAGIAAARQLTLLYDLPLELAAQTQLDALLQTVVMRLVEVLPGASSAALFLWDGSRGELLLQAQYPAGQSSASMTLAHRAMSERRAFIWRRIEEGNLSHSIIQHHIEAGMYAPLMWQNELLGAICVDNLRSEAQFAENDLRLMMVVAQYAAMAISNHQLQRNLRDAWTGALDALTAALATRDNDTKTHCYRTVELAVELAQRMGLDEAEVCSIARGALLHDIGKIGISDQILLKPGPLTESEHNVIKHHARLGYDMLKHIQFFHDALPVVLHHHESYDGAGYPEGLKGEDIPLAARIFHVVDMYDALTHERPYKSVWTHEAALAELKKYCGIRYDPRVVEVFETLESEVTERIRCLQAFSPATRELLGHNISKSI